MDCFSRRSALAVTRTEICYASSLIQSIICLILGNPIFVLFIVCRFDFGDNEPDAGCGTAKLERVDREG